LFSLSCSFFFYAQFYFREAKTAFVYDGSIHNAENWPITPLLFCCCAPCEKFDINKSCADEWSRSIAVSERARATEWFDGQLIVIKLAEQHKSFPKGVRAANYFGVRRIDEGWRRRACARECCCCVCV
jgi:hypothetical protein